MHACMHGCMYAFMYVCYKCIYIYIYVHTYAHTPEIVGPQRGGLSSEMASFGPGSSLASEVSTKISVLGCLRNLAKKP